MEYLKASINKYLDISPVVNFLNNHPVVSACATAGILYGAWYLKRPRNLPPGPWGYPIVGSMFTLFKLPDMGVNDLRKKYGDVCCLWLGGNTYWTILSGYETIKEAYITRGADFMDRDTDKLTEYFGLDDTIFNAHYDETYKASRKLAALGIRTLINTKLQLTLEDDLDQIEAELNQSLGQPVNLSPHVKKTVANSMLGFMFGTHHKHNDTEFTNLTLKLDCMASHTVETFSAFVISSRIQNFFMSKTQEMAKEELSEFIGFLEKHVDEHLESGYSGEVRDLIDVYLQSKGPIKFSKLKIASTFSVFLPDTMLTAHDMVLWMLVYLINYPECQEEICQEVQNVCGSVGVSLKKRPEMPVTESFIMEVFRLITPIQFSVIGKPVKTTTFRGYNIPESMGILAHYGGVHKDPKYFPEPDTFKPRRFVKDGKIGNAEGFLPFGMGRRMCLGEPFVRNMIFYMTARLVSQYKISSPDGKKLSTEPILSTVYCTPKPFSVVLQRREKDY